MEVWFLDWLSSSLAVHHDASTKEKSSKSFLQDSKWTRPSFSFNRWKSKQQDFLCFRSSLWKVPRGLSEPSASSNLKRSRSPNFQSASGLSLLVRGNAYTLHLISCSNNIHWNPLWRAICLLCSDIVLEVDFSFVKWQVILNRPYRFWALRPEGFNPPYDPIIRKNRFLC